MRVSFSTDLQQHFTQWQSINRKNHLVYFWFNMNIYLPYWHWLMMTFINVNIVFIITFSDKTKFVLTFGVIILLYSTSISVVSLQQKRWIDLCYFKQVKQPLKSNFSIMRYHKDIMFSFLLSKLYYFKWYESKTMNGE